MLRLLGLVGRSSPMKTWFAEGLNREINQLLYDLLCDKGLGTTKK